MTPPSISIKQSLPPALIASFASARRVMALTGAGVSAESGVPTFRDARQGLWARHDPMSLATPEGFKRDPGLVWDWYVWRRQLIAGSRPNAGHDALARMQTLVPALSLVTQNVDGFHQLAGSESVLELHGNIQRSICSQSRRPITPDWLEQHRERSPAPSPHHPEGLARPDVVWFGEALDADILDAAFAAAQSCDLIIVAGTSGVVHPAAGLPAIAVKAGAVMIEINPAVSELTAMADWHLAGPSANWLPRLVDTLQK